MKFSKQGLMGVLSILMFLSVELIANTNGPPIEKPEFPFSAIEEVLIPFGDENPEETKRKLADSFEFLSKKQTQYKNTVDFAEYVYRYVHRKYLKEYNEFTSLPATLINGSYDCLTGTTIYTLFFTELGIDHAIVETNYHIYILLFPGTESEVLLESTEPINGFITDHVEISKLKAQYLAANNKNRNVQFKLDLNLENYLEGKEIVGLLYYNQSIKKINEGAFSEAKELAQMALSYYSGERVMGLINWLDGQESVSSI